ncbi:phospholipase D-like domain-containing protein [Nocardioides xinjiangensis]|uniref:phospholipase D-like domain-containing protein n=1 Tax=Nocardioides xinjiangensis TaxID=2817376 RepID=UPI001B30CAC0|nr:phospholipase D-like domain-containing protein [Nocardioides sp. SYSU D00514]
MTRSSRWGVAAWTVLCVVLGVTAPAPAAAGAPGAARGAALGAPAAATADEPRPGSRSWRAPSGPFFNDPHLAAGHFRIERKVIDTIRHTRKGSTIRIAIYSLDRMPVAQALAAAHRRGVRVQILLNDHWETPAMKVIRAEIGKDRRRDSFIYKCRQSCRGAANEFNNLHSKLYLFSEAGRSEDVIAVGSANMTRNAAIHQWNDLYFTEGDHELFRQFVGLFNDMRRDYDTRQEPMQFCGTPLGAACDDSVDKHTAWAFPRVSGPKNDLVLDMLDRVQCRTTDPATGKVTRTRLALSMHTMRGDRGNYLAAGIRRKFIQGCDVRVSYGLIGYHTKGILGAPTARGRIPLRSTGLDYNTEDNFDLNNDGLDDLILDYYSHQKYFVVRGTYNGVPDTEMVLTGSVNWSSLSTANDEIWFTVRGAVVARKYMANFNYQWDHRRNSRNAYTTTYANFRVPRTVRAPDGTLRTTYVTVRRPVTTVEPDRYLPGPYWEAD